MADAPGRTGITGLILAGGQGSRMGGADKGLLPLADRPLISHVHARLAPQVARLLISANRNLAAHAAWADAVVEDASGDRPGPLAGILAGLTVTTTPWLVVVPCDSPFIPEDLVARLAARVAPGGIAMVETVEGDQPVFALVCATLRADLAEFLAAGGRKILDWYARHPLARVHFADAGAFANINTPAEHAAARQHVDA